MRSKKNLIFLTIIIALLSMSAINFSFFSNTPKTNQIPNINLDSGENLISDPVSADADNTDRLEIAEEAAKWLWKEWNDNNFNRTGTISLGQTGVAGVGDLFIELYKKTGNSTYLSYAENLGDWLIDKHNELNYPNGKWPETYGQSNPINYTGWDRGIAGIGAFFLKLYQESLDPTYDNQVIYANSYLMSLEKQTASSNGYAWTERVDNKVLNNAEVNPKNNTILNGTEAVGTSLSNLNDYDGNTYDIDSEAVTDISNVIYKLNSSDLGSLLGIDTFGSRLTVSMHLSADSSINGEVSIYNDENSSYEILYDGSISTAETFITRTYYANFTHYFEDNYMNVRVNTSAGSAHTVQINSLNFTLDYNNGYNSTTFSTGAAGIGRFYLEYYIDDGNSQYEDRAKGAANFLLEEAIEFDNKIAWNEKGTYFNSMRSGAGGIADFFLDLYDELSDNTYLTGAKKAANWIIGNNDTAEAGSRTEVLILGETNQTDSPLYGGANFMAGIGDMLIRLGQLSSEQIYITNASYIANWLSIENFYIEFESQYGFDRIYRWKERKNGELRFGYSSGCLGNLVFLDNLFLETQTSRYAEYLSGGLEWVKTESNITAKGPYWYTNESTYYVSYDRVNGLAGVAYGLLQIDLQRPSISASTTPAQFEYSENQNVIFQVNPYYSTINKCRILYKFGTEPQPTPFWDTDAADMEQNGNYYNFSFSSENLNHDYNIFYHVVAIDQNGTFMYDDNNGLNYTLSIVDTNAPPTTIIPKWGDGVGANQRAELEIRVTKEPSQASTFSRVRIDAPDLDISNDLLYRTVDFSDKGTYYSATYEINVGSDVSYDKKYEITFRTYDEKNNELTNTENLPIIDNFDPYCDVINDFDLVEITSWTVQFTPVAVEANVYDDESGIDPEEGVYIKYTTDKGATWQTVYLEETSSNKYEGEIPGQVFLGEVYFVLGAKDKVGNEVIWDKFGGEHENIEDISLDLMWSYRVDINIWIITIIGAIISGIVIVGYLIYSRKGGYLEKMRRKSKYTATGLAVKERLTNFYYKLYDGVNSLGEKIATGAKSGSQRFGIWVEDHFGESFKNTMRGIGRVIWAFPLGIAHGISNFFKAIGAALVKSKGWQVILFLIFGLAILLTTVVQFVMEGGYPLRAVFFANLGFAMVIIGITTFLIRSIYRLTYK